MELLSSRGRIEVETRRGRFAVTGKVILTRDKLLVLARKGLRRREEVVLAVPLWSVTGVARAGWIRKRVVLTIASPEYLTRTIWLEVENAESWLATLRALVKNLAL